MFELLIAASALSLIIMIFRKQSRILEQKRPIDWRMAGHGPDVETHTDSEQTIDQDEPVEPEGETSKKSSSDIEDAKDKNMADENRATPLDFFNINKHFRLAEKHFSKGEIDEAEKMYIKVLSYHDEHPESLNKLGVIYIQQNDLRKAELMFNKLMNTPVKDPGHFANYGRCLYSLNRIEEAISALEKAIEIDKTKASRFISLGSMYYEMHKYSEALEAFSRALDLDPYNPSYLNMVADVSEEVGDTERLLKTLKKMLDIDPYNYEVKRRFDKVAKKRG